MKLSVYCVIYYESFSCKLLAGKFDHANTLNLSVVMDSTKKYERSQFILGFENTVESFKI